VQREPDDEDGGQADIANCGAAADIRARALGLPACQGPGGGPAAGAEGHPRRKGRGPVTIDLDATIVIAHSEKEQAAPTWKKTFGHHPLTAWADHGQDGSGEPLAIMLRAGNAGRRGVVRARFRASHNAAR
jgi:hypothetical protein